MRFSAICFSHKYLLIRNISGKREETVQWPFNEAKSQLISLHGEHPFILLISSGLESG